MEYFTKQELDAMLDQFREFDRKLIHEACSRTIDEREKMRAAGLLDCSRRAVRELVEKGTLRFIVHPEEKIRISKKLRYRLLNFNS